MQMQTRFGGTTARTLGSLAVTALMALAAPAQAVIVSSGPVSIAIPDDIDGVYLNVVTGAFGAAPPAGWDLNPYSALSGQFNLWGATTTTWFSPNGTGNGVDGTYPLAAGTMIAGPTTSFFRTGGALDVGTQVTLNATNLFGFRFANEAQAGANNFGWVAIRFDADAGTRRITSFAYQNDGSGIMAGVVPEPGTYAMMALGLAAMGGFVARRRKQDQAA